MKTRKGITLVELIIVLALLGLVISGGTSLLLFSRNVHGKTTDEFDIQSNSRIIIQNINSTVRDSAATFLLHRGDADRENVATFTEGWNYILLSNDKSKLLQYSWDETEGEFIKKELMSSIDGVKLDLVFNKLSKANEDNLLEYILTLDVNGKTRNFTTELEGVNSLQIVDRAYGKVANTLAYRFDTKLSEVSNSQAAVAMVLDQSGSMRYRMNGQDANDNSSNSDYHSRMKKLKAEATRFINELAKQPNIFVSINPFASTGNSSREMLRAQVNNTANNDLLTYINGLSANGGTNTGDGIRRGYYRVVEFNEKEENKNKTNKNFMIILVDGVTTFASVKRVDEIYYDRVNMGTTITVDDQIYYLDRTENRGSGRNRYTRYYYVGVQRSNYVTGDGNISSNEASVNTDYPSGRYAGDGGNLDPWGTEYVSLIGQMVRDYKEGTNESIKVYVIGFSARTADYGSLRDIALATSGEAVFYEAGDEEALNEIFLSIQRDISDALWHIGGPN